MPNEFTMPTGRPTQRPTGRPTSNSTPPTIGVPYVQINQAREMFASTTRARAPPGSQTTSSRTSVPRPAPSSSSSPLASFTSRTPNTSSHSTSTSISISTSTRLVDSVNPPVDTMGIPLPNVSIPAKNHTIDECRNPQCAHCGRVIIPSPVASFPAIETPSISVGDWEVYTTKQPILASDEIDAETERLGMPLPEMIFGHNKVDIKNKSKGFAISFNTPDALSLVDTTGENLLQVAHSEEWFSTRKTNGDDVKGIVKPFDWTYSTPYRGSLPENVKMIESPGLTLPWEKLKRPDPILFFDDMVLYEDELGDNGISVLSAKIRVMPERLLLLTRFFLRVDDVIFRVRDTRVYVDFTENQVIREYREQEASYDVIRKKISALAGDPRSFMRNPNWIAEKLPVIKTITDTIQL
ncbi:CYFA0S08e04764g1_1 [Cyberlindnera fabianii]|uniref:CYFA0S08e04764g1_1 n=1 Tax=Cyberlindnera fabianii TaxID=36022 RepID=A0A061B3F2_CYBFA|nr:CYFA0S08e04764g1_1 [Cyberlindnera fabianii]